MKVTKKHIVYLTVLAIGGGWLSMDYFTGGTASDSSASAAVINGSSSPESAPSTALAADMGDEPAIAQRLDKLNQSCLYLTAKGTVDGFALPAAFVPAAPTPSVSNIPVATAASTFVRTHTLTSVMVGGRRRPAALVDGQSLLKIGDKLDGFVLTTVTKTSAVFNSSGGARAVLGFNFGGAGQATASIQGQ